MDLPMTKEQEDLQKAAQEFSKSQKSPEEEIDQPEEVTVWIELLKCVKCIQSLLCYLGNVFVCAEVFFLYLGL